MDKQFFKGGAEGAGSSSFFPASLNELRFSKTASGNDLCQLPTPIEFDCVVNSKPLKASLTHAEDDGTQYMYHVRFSDTYKAVFMLNRELRKWVEMGQRIPSSYAQGINLDLFILNEFNPLHPPFSLSVNVKGETVKVWVRKERTSYAVFFKEEFRFFLHNFTGKWKAETIDVPKSYIVEEINEAVVLRLGQGSLN